MTSPPPLKFKLYDYGLSFYPARTRLMLMEKGFPSSHLVQIDLLKCENLSRGFMKKSKGRGTLPLLEIYNEAGDQVVQTLYGSREISAWLETCDGIRLGAPALDGQFDKVDHLCNILQEFDGNIYKEARSNPKEKPILDAISAYRLQFAKSRLEECKKEISSSELVGWYQEKVAKMDEKNTEADYKMNQNQLNKILDLANSILTNQPYLAGQAYSAADVLLTTILWRIHQTGQWKEEMNGEQRAAVKQWYHEIIMKRPSFAKTFEYYPYQKNPLRAILGLLPSFLYFKFTGKA